MMKSLLRKLAQLLRNHDLLFSYAEKSYAQEGEDMLLRRIFEGKKTGFYVDVGAHHPMRFSNTYYFYKKGWSGINVDAMPGSMKKFERMRNRDINVEAAVSSHKKSLKFYMFEEPALNTFSSELMMEYVAAGHEVANARIIKTRKLSDVLEEYIPPNVKIDYMSIDVEGEDVNVLESNDWTRFRPDYVLVEILDASSWNELTESKEYKKMTSLGYDFFAKTVNTVIFRNKEYEL